MDPAPSILHPGSRILNPGSWIQDQGYGILDPRSRILDPGSQIRDPGSGILDPGSSMLHPGSRILNPGSWILDSASRILDGGSRIQDPGSRDPGIQPPIPGIEMNSNSRDRLVYPGKLSIRGRDRVSGSGYNPPGSSLLATSATNCVSLFLDKQILAAMSANTTERFCASWARVRARPTRGPWAPLGPLDLLT